MPCIECRKPWRNPIGCAYEGSGGICVPRAFISMLESGVDLFVAVGGTEEERDGVSGEWELLSMQFRMDQTKTN